MMCDRHRPTNGVDSAPPGHGYVVVSTCCECGTGDYVRRSLEPIDPHFVCPDCKRGGITPCIVCGAPIRYGIGHDPGCLVASDVERAYDAARVNLELAQAEYATADMRLRAAYATRDLSSGQLP